MKGDAQLTLVPSPNDPFGRTLGPVKGPLKGAETSVITSFTPFPPAPFVTEHVTTQDVLVTGPGEMITATSAATWTPVPSAPPGNFTVDGTQTITGGTGDYSGATGTIHVTGFGYNVFGPGTGYFDLEYDGTICT